MLRIRPAAPSDTGTIVQFIEELADYEKLRHECKATAEAIAQHLFGPAPKAEAILAEWQSQPVGFALYFHNFSTFLAKPGIYLEDLYVQPAFRAKGIGKALLVHLAQLAQARGCGRLEWSVLNWNAPSIAFYESLGAQAKDEWTVYRLEGPSLNQLAAVPG
jgi:GNAT superfamily N-acetyltransferase